MQPEQQLAAGDVFLDRWTIREQVGRGGFSTVYKGTDRSGRVAAIKVLRKQENPEDGGNAYDDDLADRFLREARLLEQLDSPYTISLWEYGRSPQDQLYMVFEFINGRMLFDEIKTKGRLEESRIIHILRQTLIGLEAAHALGILHRDIKPNNVMLYERDDDPDRVKLVDFGIAKRYDGAGDDLTAAGLLVGTPRYMSPEQLRGQALSPAADLYSLGLCAVEMLTGRKCVPGTDRIKIVEAQLRPEPVRLPADVEISDGLRSVVHKLCEKDLGLRYANATSALRDLESLAGDPGATGDTVFQTVPEDFGREELDPDDKTVVETVNPEEIRAYIEQQKAFAEAAKEEPGLDEEDSEVDPFGFTMAAPAVALPPLGGAPADEPPADPTLMDTGGDDGDATVGAKPFGEQKFGVGGPESDFMSQFGADPSQSGERLRTGSGGQSPPPGAFGGSAGSGPVPGPFGSGQFQQPTTADGSGQMPTPGAYGSGQFQQPGPHGSGQFQQPGPHGSGQFQQPGPHGSGQFQQPGAYGSGQFNQPSGQMPVPGGAYGSGQFNQPSGQMPAPGGAYGSGQFQQPGYGQTPYGHSNYNPNNSMVGGPPQQPQGRRPKVPLSSDDKLAIGASFLVPGVGQIIEGQYVKGGGIMLVSLILVVLLTPLLWALLAPIAMADTFLLVKTSKLRPVGKFEFFPDWRAFL